MKNISGHYCEFNIIHHLNVVDITIQMKLTNYHPWNLIHLTNTRIYKKNKLFTFTNSNTFSGKCINNTEILHLRQNTTVQPSIENKSRRRRTAFTSGQLLELEREFQAKKYLSLTERSEIANSLKLSEVQVIIFS